MKPALGDPAFESRPFKLAKPFEAKVESRLKMCAQGRVIDQGRDFTAPLQMFQELLEERFGCRLEVGGHTHQRYPFGMMSVIPGSVLYQFSSRSNINVITMA